MAAGDPPSDDAPTWEIYALTDATGKPFFVGETRRGHEVRLREHRRAGRLGPRDSAELLVPAAPDGLRDIGSARAAAHYMLDKLGLLGG